LASETQIRNLPLKNIVCPVSIEIGYPSAWDGFLKTVVRDVDLGLSDEKSTTLAFPARHFFKLRGTNPAAKAQLRPLTHIHFCELTILLTT
jgi:hypothetical protein